MLRTWTVRLRAEVSTSKFHQGQRGDLHQQAGCMAALCSCKPEAEKDRLAYGGVHVSIEDRLLIDHVLAHLELRTEHETLAPFASRGPPQPSLL